MSRASNTQIDRLYAAISLSGKDDGGDILDAVREAVGRWDFDYYDELTSDEIERAIRGMEGS